MPLKIKYLRSFMDTFASIKPGASEDESIDALCECVRIAMEQFCPEISDSIDSIQDNLDLHSIYRVLDIAAGIKVNEKSSETVTKQATSNENTWESLDLAKIESEAFLLGIWKDYEELERSMSMPELLTTLSIKRELDYSEKKFLAAVQGVDLDKESGQQDAWEKMKAKVFSGGKTNDANDIVAFQGANAQKAGFGIGMGLQYEDLTKK